MQYRLNGTLLFAENEEVTGRVYTHATVAGDRVIRYHQSLASAEEDLAGLQADAAAQGKRMRALYDRRKEATNLRPDQGSVVRAPGLDAMYPTLPELRTAIERQRRYYQSLHVAALELSGAAGDSEK